MVVPQSSWGDMKFGQSLHGHRDEGKIYWDTFSQRLGEVYIILIISDVCFAKSPSVTIFPTHGLEFSLNQLTSNSKPDWK